MIDEMIETPDGDYLSCSDAAAMLGIHRDTIRRWADAGTIDSVRSPAGHRRFLITDLQQLRTSRMRGAA